MQFIPAINKWAKPRGNFFEQLTESEWQKKPNVLPKEAINKCKPIIAIIVGCTLTVENSLVNATHFAVVVEELSALSFSLVNTETFRFVL